MSQKRFARVPVRLFDGSFEGADLMVYRALSQSRKTYVDELASTTKLSRSTVIRSLKRLQESGLIDVIERGARGRPAHYKLLDPAPEALPLVS